MPLRFHNLIQYLLCSSQQSPYLLLLLHYFRRLIYSMKQVFLGIFLLLMVACGESYEVPDTSLDCGRQFIDAIFKGNFKRARQLMVPSEQNLQLLNERLAKDFRARNSLDKDQLRNASIVINQVENISDSITIINFLNSYDNKPAVLKVVKYQGQWMTDLKYTFSGNF